MLYFVYAYLARAHVAACRPEVFHACECELAEIAVFDARGHERHRDVALHAVDARPGRDEREDARDEVNEGVGRVVFVAAGAPELVEARAADDEGRVDFQAVGAERGVLEVFFELVDVALHANVGQVRHHVRNDFEAGVFGERERVRDGRDGVSSVGVAGDVFVERLYADFETCAAVAEHGGEMRLEAVVGPRLDGDADAFGVAHFACFHCFVDVLGAVAA